MCDDETTWTADDVPPGPYLHGTRRTYEPGALLWTDAVNTYPGEEDDRQRCFATTSIDEALHWASQRAVSAGEVLNVYEVEMVEPEVDVNVHPHGSYGDITSVMSHTGRVVRLVRQVSPKEYRESMRQEK
jgi:hypothetical protein